jgi:hypothetical protein
MDITFVNYNFGSLLPVLSGFYNMRGGIDRHIAINE